MVHYLPLPILQAARWLRRKFRRRPAPLPTDVVKLNTREAFDYFFRQDAYINATYLSDSRLQFYDEIAAYCAALPLTHPSGTLRIGDIGCGTGHMLHSLKECLPSDYSLQLYGVDFARSAVNRARKLLPEATFLAEDLYATSLPSDTFDLVVCIQTLEHLREPTRALDEMLRVCQPGGSIVITVPNGAIDTWEGHINFWTRDQFEALLFPCGKCTVGFSEDTSGLIAHVIKP